MQAQVCTGQLQCVSHISRVSPRVPQPEACARFRDIGQFQPFGASASTTRTAQLYGTKVKVSFMDVSSIVSLDLLPNLDVRDRQHLEQDDSNINKAQLLQEVSSLRSQLRNAVAERNRLAMLAEQTKNSLEKLQNDASVIAHWEKVHLWSEYATARKRILALMDEKEILDIKLSREKTESRCQIRHRLEAEQKLKEANSLNHALMAQLNSGLHLSAAS